MEAIIYTGIIIALILIFAYILNKFINKADNLIDNRDKLIDDLKNGKKEYTEEEKIEWVKKRKEAIQKGKDYEEQIAEYYRELNYLVDERGKRKGKKDNGIDILIKKDDTYTLIQCKNYAPTTQLTQKQLRAFYGDCEAFVKKNNLNNETTKFKLIISNKESLTSSAKQYIKDYKNFECVVQEFKNNSQ